MNVPAQVSPTAAQLIEHALLLHSRADEIKRARDAEMKPYVDGLETIENTLLEMLNAQGAHNFATDAGTAYKSTLTSVKVADRDAYLRFVLENWDAVGSEMLLASAQKDSVKRWLDERGSVPGLEVSQHVRVNIRKS